MDWENVTLSPIWDVDLGFGGDGDSSKGERIFDAYCVAEGPFAGWEVPYFENVYHPHCLLRGFDEHLADFRSALTPEAVDKILDSRDYEA